MKLFFNVLKCIIEQHKLVWRLSVNDFKHKYVGSYLGVIWSFIQPLVTVLIYWFVFEKGFRNGPRPDGTPFLVWLVCGLAPWFFFNEAIISASGSFIEYSYLVKKMKFPISLLPVIKNVSALFVHVIFLVILFLFMIFYGINFSFIGLQLIYYLVCLLALIFSMSFIVSTMTPFFKDMRELIGIILQIQFWMTPIVWSEEILTPAIEWIFKLNPLYYIVQGYRNSLVNNVPFWESYNEMGIFWLTVFVLFSLGSYIYYRSEDHLPDVI